MTEMKKDEENKNALKDSRIKRRSVLKAGAVIAPLALTLHGGIPLAHAGSFDCLAELATHVQVPNFEPDDEHDGYESDDEHDGFESDHEHDGYGSHHKNDGFESDHEHDGYKWTGTNTNFDPDNGTFTGRLNPDGLTQETHWDYLINEGMYGASCLQSIQMQNIH